MPSPGHLTIRRPHVVLGDTYTKTRWLPFQEKHTALGGAPGVALSTVPERVGAGGYVVRYQNGSIYERPDGRCAWVHGAIGDRYRDLGGPNSWLGFPASDELEINEGGRISHFDNGDIYWWPDVGAVELNEVIVHYTGLFCFGETDWDQMSAEDEPYVILGAIAPNGRGTARSPVYDDVDRGESRPDVIELFRGKPAGIVLNAMLMEHDDDDPDRYKAAMQEGINAGLQAACSAVTLGACSVPVLREVIGEFSRVLAKAVSDLLDLRDDELGIASIPLSQKQMVVLAARTTMSVFQGVGFKVETPLLGENAGASYKVYFNLVCV